MQKSGYSCFEPETPIMETVQSDAKKVARSHGS